MSTSPFDTLFAETSVAALQAVHGISVTRWPGGHSGAAVTVTGCLWTPDENPERNADMDAERIVFSGVLQVPVSAGADRTDKWVIDDREFATIVVGDPHGKMQTVALRHVDKVQTSRHRDGFY